MSTWIARSPRNTDFWAEQTPGEVGPGSYNPNSTASTAAAGLAPFLISSDKPISQSANVSFIEAQPGPGSYDLDASVRKSLWKKARSKSGSVPFVSRQPRWAPNAPGSTIYTTSTVIANPGPGNYNVRWRTGAKQKAELEKHKDLVVQPSGGPPSIPVQARTTKDRKGDTYTGRPGDTTGPAFYAPNYGFSKPRSKTADFMRSKYKRRLWEPQNEQANNFTSRENPGPGTYDPARPGTGAAALNVEVQGTASFNSKVKTADQITVPEEKRLPGPQDYNPSTAAQDVAKFSTLQGFGSTTYGRDTWSHDQELPYTSPHRLGMPGVGVYTLDEKNRRDEAAKRKAINYESYPVVNPPFKSTESRDCNKESRAGPPGPGQYDSNGQPQVSSYSGQIREGNGSFGANTKRFVGLFAPKEGPGPGSYEGKMKGQTAPAANFFTSPGETYTVFRSTTSRFPDHEKNKPNVKLIGEKEIPGAGQYHVPASWVKENRSDDYKVLHKELSFDSSAIRFNPKADVQGAKIKATPGPGTYRNSSAGPAGGRLTKCIRFSGPGTYRPKTGTTSEIGPGTYNTEGTMAKKSFNMTIEQPDKAWMS